MARMPSLAFFSYLGANRPPRVLLADSLDLARAVEDSGLESFWVAQHHFADPVSVTTGKLPSPLVFLASAAAVTRRIRLGTAVVILPAEPPLRLAEDAAVLQALSGGRVELGLGSGTEPSVFDELGVDRARRRDLMAGHLATLRAALAGESLPLGHRLWPAETVPLWQGVFSEERAVEAATARCHLLLPKLAVGTTGADQARIIAAYRRACPPDFPGRVALSRLVYPTTGDVLTQWRVELDFQRSQLNAGLAQQGHEPWGEEAYLNSGLAYTGSPEQVAAALAADPAVQASDVVMAQFGHAGPAQKDALAAITALGRTVAPRLLD